MKFPDNGPDALRYRYAAQGNPMPRPFHLRWLLPAICGGAELRRWWVAWVAGWVLAAAGMFSWAVADGGTWQIAAASTVLLLGLPGFLGPPVNIPVSVDIPATGLALCGVAVAAHGWLWPGVTLVAVAAAIRETSPVWAALWAWHPAFLVALIVPAVTGVVRRPGPDPLGDKFQWIADHPFRSALDAHQGRWRDGWLMVAPWGACLAALLEPTWPLLAILGLAYCQLVVATDTVRLLHHAAGPAMAVTAANVIPERWLLLIVAVHVVWWLTPERV